MSIAALITEGVGPGGSITYLLTGGLDIGQQTATGTLSVTLGTITDTATGTVLVTGTLIQTLGALTLIGGSTPSVWTPVSASSGVWTPVSANTDVWTPATD
jgi:hypothetical protein